jgi:hypothetical protein
MRQCMACKETFSSSESYWTHFTNHLGPGTLCKSAAELETWGFTQRDDGSWETWYEVHNTLWDSNRALWSSLFKPAQMFDEMFPRKTPEPRKTPWWKRIVGYG